ncbi:VTT domain-containing protein [Bacillus sp. SM2101]|uniref:DedA family protein n=1 Tax=Bacillus sp. SM2101 TaxID=2805366 RepID=UPI001BDF7002|nr:VTT domain-containing protein [Bacillus sp. SM2101]
MNMLELIQNLGTIGLFISMFLEGSSIPFPGIVVVLSYGLLLNPSHMEIVLTSLGMASMYTVASLIPYVLGAKMTFLFPKRFWISMEKARCWFRRYGVWSISLSRPFGIGNYISYVAGISNVKLRIYLVHTFLGILPWSVAVLMIGKLGNVTKVKQLFQEYDVYIYLLGALILISYLILLWIKLKNNAGTYMKEEIENSKQQQDSVALNK